MLYVFTELCVLLDVVCVSASVIICNRGRPFIVHRVFFILRRSQYATRRITLLGTPFDRFDRYCHRTGTDSSGRPLNHNVIIL